MMNEIRAVSFMAFIIVHSICFAQDTDQIDNKGLAEEYARSSLSYLLLDFSSEPYANMLKVAIKSTEMPTKYDNNELKKKVIPAPYIHSAENANVDYTSKNAESIRKALVNEQYALDIVKYWWRIKENGYYSVNLIKERGEYNATDDEVKIADNTKVGRARIGDHGVKLIGNSYVLVLDYKYIKSMDEIYDAQDNQARESAEKNKTQFVPVKREKNGFHGNITAYLYKMNYTDTVQGYLDMAFINSKKIDLEKLKVIFDHVYSPFRFITSESQSIEATQSNSTLIQPIQASPEELMNRLVNIGISKVIDNIEKRIEEFRVKTPVTNVGPIRAKIGEKESLKHERRFFIWEYVSNSNDKVVAHKKGVVRASKVTKNINDDLGNTSESTFYQIGGGKIKTGMTMQEAKDFGMGIGAGFGTGGLAIRADLNVGQLTNASLKQVKLYFEFLSAKSEFASDSINKFAADQSLTLTLPPDNMYNDVRIAFGIMKEYPFMRNFHAGWLVGCVFENITWEGVEDEEKFSSIGFHWGLKFGFNIFSPSVQLYTSVNGQHFSQVNYTPKGEDPENLQTGLKWSNLFPEKKTVTYDIGLRLNF